MDRENIIEFLRKNRGYLKWGDVRIADKFNVDLDIAAEAKWLVKHGEYSIQEEEEDKAIPNILFLDLEIAPTNAWVWGLWDQNVALDMVESNWFILSWAAEWLGTNKQFSHKLTGEEALNQDDTRILTPLWEALDKADIVIAHNGDKYDIKKMKTRFVLAGMKPTSTYKSIDTLKVAKKEFNFPSNKLDALASYFGLEGKKSTGLKLWISCVKGDEEALAYMDEYCKQDIVTLRDVYLKLRPWISNHPNVNIYNLDDDMRCNTCGSKNLIEIQPAYSSVGIYTAYRCECGAISKERFSKVKKEVTKNILKPA